MASWPALTGSFAHKPTRRRFGRKWWWLLPLAVVAVGAGGFRIWQWAVVPADAPVIGVSVDTSWHAQIGLTTVTYHTALTRAHAKIIEFRPGQVDPDKLLDGVDAILIAGGGDVDPALYAGDPGAAKLVDRERDDFELALIEGALRRKMPVLGICRGIQILNVAHGGSLRNIRADDELRASHGSGLADDHEHAVTIAAGSRLAAIVGAGTKAVNSFHGQAVHRVGTGLTVVARSPDGVVEGVERTDDRWLMAVQWHPEILSVTSDEDLRVFESFVDEAQRFARSRARTRAK